MGLKGSDAQGGRGTGIKSPKNTFVRIGTIVSAVQNQNYKPHESFNDPVDIGIEMKLSVEGLTFEPSVSVMGNFARDAQTRDISGWGSAFKIADLFAVLGFDLEELELDANNKVPEKFMKELIGKKITYLSYVTDQGKTRNWDRFANEDMAEGFGDYFMEDWEKSGYPKAFDPTSKLVKKKKEKTSPSSSDPGGPFDAGNGGVPI
ncbi:MAG: hypothetical protein H8D23_29230 [Candidatus Brocadiales bacterium]|nr:hypothetical protein [Candidatus Brocadiales bacterium]